MPWIFAGACVVFACTSLLQSRPVAITDAFDSGARAGQHLLSMLWALLRVVVSGVLTIKVHRFVLLGEGAHPLVPLNGRPLGRYALTGFVFMAIAMALAIFTFIVAHSIAMGLAIYLPFLFISLFVFIRLSLLYPSISLGGRLTLRAAWRDGRGHVWTMVGVSFVTYLPLFVLGALLLRVVDPQAMNDNQQVNLVIGIVQAIFNAVFVVLAAASLSWLYRRYARELLSHAENPAH